MGGYQDYVIKDGALVGDFDGLYREFDDPWHQSRGDHVADTRRAIAINYCARLRSAHGDLRFPRESRPLSGSAVRLCERMFLCLMIVGSSRLNIRFKRLTA